MKGADWSSTLKDYGASYGGNCVLAEGTFKKPSGGYIYSQSQVSVQAQCSNSKTSYTLTFKNFAMNSSGRRSGDATVTCTSAGNKQFNTSYRYPSTVKCYTPSDFCKRRFGKIGAAKCDDTCVQNGRCQRVSGNRRRMETKTMMSANNFASEYKRKLGYFDDWCTDNGYTKGGSSSSGSRSSSSSSGSGSSSSSSRPSSSGSSSGSSSSSSNGSSSPVTSFGQSTSGRWQCWCYSDGRRRTACPSLSEDRDGEGY